MSGSRPQGERRRPPRCLAFFKAALRPSKHPQPAVHVARVDEAVLDDDAPDLRRLSNLARRRQAPDRLEGGKSQWV
jgi:hypothetical protein